MVKTKEKNWNILVRVFWIMEGHDKRKEETNVCKSEQNNGIDFKFSSHPINKYLTKLVLYSPRHKHGVDKPMSEWKYEADTEELVRQCWYEKSGIGQNIPKQSMIQVALVSEKQLSTTIPIGLRQIDFLIDISELRRKINHYTKSETKIMIFFFFVR